MDRNALEGLLIYRSCIADTNGRLFDPEIAAWNATNASTHMCVSKDGPYREIYHSTGPAANISFYLADPADTYWQNIFTSIAKRMQQAGVDGKTRSGIDLFAALELIRWRLFCE